MNIDQMKLDAVENRNNIIIPTKSINDTFESEADSEYSKKKKEERYEIIQQLNRVYY